MDKDQPTRSFLDPEQLDTSLSLWYYDGTIVLEASDVVFRVYAGVLATKSTVLHKILNPYTRPEKPETYDSCPLIHLPHKALDLYYFLTAVYDSSTFFEGPMWLRFSAVSALLRLGTHYKIDHFREKAITWLTATYPSSLSLHSTRRHIEQSLEAYVLIRDMNVIQCLPAVSYECAVFSGPSLVLHSGLSENEKHSLLQGSQTLIDAQLALFRSVNFNSGEPPPEGIPSCRTPGRCNLGKLTGLGPNLLIFPENFDPLRPSFPRLTWEEYAQMTCAHCCIRAQLLYDKKRATLWKRLPEVFRLSKWSEIEAKVEGKDVKEDMFDKLTSMIFRRQRPDG